MFTAECGQNEVVLIESALYGRMKLGRCVSQVQAHKSHQSRRHAVSFFMYLGSQTIWIWYVQVNNEYEFKRYRSRLLGKCVVKKRCSKVNLWNSRRRPVFVLSPLRMNSFDEQNFYWLWTCNHLWHLSVWIHIWGVISNKRLGYVVQPFVTRAFVKIIMHDRSRSPKQQCLLKWNVESKIKGCDVGKVVPLFTENKFWSFHTTRPGEVKHTVKSLSAD